MWVFPSLWVVVAVALSGHFLGNILSGRAKRRFGKEWAWPHHDSHPPALPKFLHFTHVLSMFGLGISGTFIAYGYFPIRREFLQFIHYVFMFIVVVNLVWRLWYAFSSKQRDYREFAITKQDIITAPKVVLYYIFVKPSKPHLGKYNVMQKGTYILFAPLLILQAITGFLIWYAPLPLIGPEGIKGLAASLMGANGSTIVYGLKLVHFVLNWLFIILTTIHAYLSVTEDLPAFLDFFGLGMLDKRSGHDGAHDDHGHGHDHEHDSEPAPAYASAEHG